MSASAVAPSHATAPRTARACTRCRNNKSKCLNNGSAPCQSCRASGHSCVFPPTRKERSIASRAAQAATAGLPHSHVASRGYRSLDQLAQAATNDRISCLRPSDMSEATVSTVVDASPSHSSPAAQVYLPSSASSLAGSLVPSADLMQEAVRHLSQHFYPDVFLFLHQPSLRDLEVLGKMDPVLCNAILTLTARFIPQLIEYHRGAQEASEYYANLIRSTLLLEADNPTLERVQALLMLSLHEWGSLRGGRAWIYVGLALQMGFLLRIIRRQGRKNLDDRIPGTPEEFLQSECRIRSFWACSMMADFISSGCDRVRLVHEERVSIPLPVSEERFLWCLVDDQTRMSAEDSEKGHLIKIVELWSEISRWVCGHKREEEQSPPWSEDSTFFRLRQALSDWAVALPPKHRYNASMFNAHAIAGYAASYGFMHLVYCTAVIFLHREYIQVLPDRSKPYWDRDGEKWGPPPDAAFWKKSLLDLFGASKRATDILNKLWSLGASVLTPFVGFSAFTASGMNIYLAILPWMCPELSVDARTYAEQTVNYLKNIMKIWPIAEKWYKSVLKLYNTYRLYVTEGVAPASPEGDVLDTFEHLDSSFLNYGEFAICPNDSGLSKGPQPTNGLLANSTDATGPVLQVSASRNETDLGEFADESLDPTHDSLEAILSQIFRDEFGDGTDIASFWPS